MNTTINKKVVFALTNLIAIHDINDENLIYQPEFRNLLSKSAEVASEDRFSVVEFYNLLTEIGCNLPATIAFQYGKFLENTGL